MRFALTRQSRNVKTGPIPVSTTSSDSCPLTCSFRDNGCYAQQGKTLMHWLAVDRGQRGTDLDGFLAAIKTLPDGQLWRHNQAGDLPGDGHAIDAEAVDALTRANAGKRGFTYTHYRPSVAGNAEVIKRANDAGFTINLSAETPAEADAFADLGIGPVVMTLPIDATENSVTPAGRRIVVCPATQRDDVTCATCQLCQRQRSTIVGFPAHGNGKAKVQTIYLRSIQ